MDEILEVFKRQFNVLEQFLGERTKRLYVGSMAKELGNGGITQVAKITKLSKATITKGIKELSDP